jgi:hypothetical protein
LVTDGLTGVVIIGGTTQIFKAIIEALGIKPDNPLHDPLIWIFALFIGVGGFVLNARLNGALTGDSARLAAGLGYLAVTSAVGHYSLVTHDYFKAALVQGISAIVPQPVPADNAAISVLNRQLNIAQDRTNFLLGQIAANTQSPKITPVGDKVPYPTVGTATVPMGSTTVVRLDSTTPAETTTTFPDGTASVTGPTAG